jgi:Fibronectin type III domain
LTCAGIYRGHSGRGGGYTLVGYACTPTLKYGLAPKHSVSFGLTIRAAAAGSINESYVTEPSPSSPQLNLFSHAAADTVAVTEPPLPAAPTALSASKVGDQLRVSWTPAAVTAQAITSSTVTLTPSGGSSAPTVTGVLGGPATAATVGPVQPQTTYLITVVNTDAAGSSPASSQISFTTPISTVAPAAPAEVRAHWLTGSAEVTGVLLASWKEGAPGDSPIDRYQAMVTPSEPEEAGPQTNTEPAPASNTEFTLMDEMGWTVRVRAHNAAAWGTWSAPLLVPGI